MLNQLTFGSSIVLLDSFAYGGDLHEIWPSTDDRNNLISHYPPRLLHSSRSGSVPKPLTSAPKKTHRAVDSISFLSIANFDSDGISIGNWRKFEVAPDQSPKGADKTSPAEIHFR